MEGGGEGWGGSTSELALQLSVRAVLQVWVWSFFPRVEKHFSHQIPTVADSWKYEHLKFKYVTR